VLRVQPIRFFFHVVTPTILSEFLKVTKFQLTPLNIRIFRVIVKSSVNVNYINAPSCNGNFSDSRALRDFLTAGLQAVTTVRNPRFACNVDFVAVCQQPSVRQLACVL
jgi:hypothetical protein